MDLKRAIAIGIGLFLAVIGLVNAGVVVRGEGTVVAMSDNLTTLRILTFAIGLALCSILVVRKVRGGLLIGIIATTVIAAIINAIWGDNAIWDAVGPGIAQVPDSVTSTPDFSLVGEFSFGFFSTLGVVAAIARGGHGDALGLLRHDGYRGRRSVRRRDSSTRTASSRT